MASSGNVLLLKFEMRNTHYNCHWQLTLLTHSPTSDSWGGVWRLVGLYNLREDSGGSLIDSL